MNTQTIKGTMQTYSQGLTNAYGLGSTAKKRRRRKARRPSNRRRKKR